MEHLALAARFVAERFPLAEAAVVGGSTATGSRTPSSDVDLLVLGPAAMLEGEQSLAATYAHEGEPIEVFAYTEEGFDAWAARGVQEARPVIVDMLVHGIPIVDGPVLQQLRERWAPVLAAGPEPDPQRIALLRYAVTDLIDDLRDAHDPFEAQATAARLLEQVAALALVSSGRWIGHGKHLARQLRALSPDRASALAAPLVASDLPGFAAAAERELDRAGGRLREGFVR